MTAIRWRYDFWILDEILHRAIELFQKAFRYYWPCTPHVKVDRVFEVGGTEPVCRRSAPLEAMVEPKLLRQCCKLRVGYNLL